MPATFLESLATAAWAEIVAPELFLKEFVSMHDADAASYLRLGWEALPSLAHRLEKNGCSSNCS